MTIGEKSDYLKEREYIAEARRSGKVARNNRFLQTLRGADNLPHIAQFLREQKLERGNEDNTY